MKKNLFITTGVDICSTKSMWNFLKYHYTYYTLNSWNNLRSIANNVKLHNLELDGDYWNAYKFLQSSEYVEVNYMIEDFESDHDNKYSVGFNGSNGGYLVLYNQRNYRNILPDIITDYDTYEDFKNYCGTSNFKSDLKYYTELVRDFDRLCEDLRIFVNELSLKDPVKEIFEDKVENFNEDYYDELKELNLYPIQIVDGKIDISKIRLSCFKETLLAYLKSDAYVLNGDNDFVWAAED